MYAQVFRGHAPREWSNSKQCHHHHPTHHIPLERSVLRGRLLEDEVRPDEGQGWSRERQR